MKKTHIIILSIIGLLLVIGIGVYIYIRTTYLSSSEIQDIVIKDTGLSKNDIYFESIDLDSDENLYDVDFYYNNVEYEYKIDAKKGKIIYNNFSINNDTTENNNSNNTAPNDITLDEARVIALNNAGLDENQVTFTETKNDLDDGIKVYDIEFIYNNQEYSYEIDATSGEIISYNKDNIRN